MASRLRLHPLLALALVFGVATSHAISLPRISPAIHNHPHLLGDGLTSYRYDSEDCLESTRNQRAQVEELPRHSNTNKKGSQGEPSLLGQRRGVCPKHLPWQQHPHCAKCHHHGKSRNCFNQTQAVGLPITWR